MSFQVSYFCSLGWLRVVPGVPLLLTGVAQHHPMCLTATNWSGSVVRCVLLPLTVVAPYNLRCFTADQLCTLCCPKVFHFRSFGWLRVLQNVPLPLTDVALCGPRCHIVIRWLVLCGQS